MAEPVSALVAIRAAMRAALARALSAAVWFVVMSIVGTCLIVAGTYMLAGTGWALVVSGGLCVLVAALLLIGSTRG